MEFGWRSIVCYRHKMAGWDEQETQIRARETPAVRVINNIVDRNRSLHPNIRAQKLATMIQNGTITRKMLDDVKKTKRHFVGPVFRGD